MHGLAAGLGHGKPFALVLAHFVNLRAQGVHPLVQRRLGGGGLPQKRRAHAVKQPRLAQGAAPDHHTVAPGALQKFQRTLGGGHVAVGQHGDRHRRLDLGDRLGVDGRHIHLLARAPVYRQQVGAVCLALLGDLDACPVGFVPADAHFYGQRLFVPQGAAGGGDHLPAQRRVQQQLAARPAVCDFRRGAAHIDVQNIKGDALFLHGVHRLFQRGRLCPEQLDGVQPVGVLVL